MAGSGELVPYHKLRFYDCQNDFSILYKRFVCKWIIKDFSKLAVGEKLVSSDFLPLPMCEWNLILQKMNQRFSLHLVNKSEERVKLKYVVSIFDLNEKTWFYGTKIVILSGEKIDILGDVSDIFEELNTLDKDTLKIICDFKILGLVGKESHYIQGNRPLSVYNGFKKLSMDLKNMHLKMETNLTLVADGGQIQAHKWILCARSPLFEKILSSRMDEHEHATISTGLKLPVLRKLVDFLYCGEVDLETDLELIGSLYSAAERFEVPDLQQMCADSLMSQLTVDNATLILVLAGRCKNSNMKRGVQDFIVEHFDEITDTDGWDRLVSHKTKLAAEVVKHYVKQLKRNAYMLMHTK